MNMLDRIFGKKTRTAAVVAAEIAAQRAAIAASRASIEKAKADRQAAVEAFDDVKHRAADEAGAAAGRDIERREHALGLLIPAHVDAVKAEERDALKARAESARRRVDEAPALLSRYAVLAAELAIVAAELKAIDDSVLSVNLAIQATLKADPDADLPQPVQGIMARFLTAPDVVTPEERVMEEVWEEPDARTGLYRTSTILNGNGRPENMAARQVRRERIIPGKTKPGQTLLAPYHGLRLPPAKLDQKPFWPAG